MTLSFDLPGVPPSPLSRLDPRWKLAALVPAAAAVAALRGLGPAAAAAAAAGALVALARLPPRWYLVRVGVMALFLALFVVFLPFTSHPGETPWQVGPVEVSPHGTLLAALITLKAVAVLTLVLVVWAT